MNNKFVILFALLLGLGSTMHAQKEIIDFLNAGKADANKLANEYLRPYGEMLGVNLNSGWYTTAKVHSVAGFDFTLSTSYTKVPSGGKSFDADPDVLGLKTVVPVGDNTFAPTMAGKESESLTMLNPETNLTFDVQGAGADYLITPMLTGAVGLPYDTEIMGRFMPQVDFGDYGKMYLWGVGVKHSLKDYIPFVKRLPFLQLSVLGAYTTFNSSVGVELNKDETGTLDMGANAYTGRLLLGANLPVVAFYTGVGYGSTKSNFDVKGAFPSMPGEDDDKVNPIALAYTTNGFDFNVGMRVRLAIFAIHADYSVGDYSVITAGVGINFR
ncbi:MAG: hypothetical protein JEZ14_03400 [Marinilabiliaceae bacterium]|nr:hypothetical protein [Marinilabiliaceae bacterium]